MIDYFRESQGEIKEASDLIWKEKDKIEKVISLLLGKSQPYQDFGKKITPQQIQGFSLIKPSEVDEALQIFSELNSKNQILFLQLKIQLMEFTECFSHCESQEKLHDFLLETLLNDQLCDLACLGLESLILNQKLFPEKVLQKEVFSKFLSKNIFQRKQCLDLISILLFFSPRIDPQI